MKKCCLEFFMSLLFLSLTSISIAQTGWVQQTSGTGFNLNSVFFANMNTGYAVGDSGSTTNRHIILKTSNGGLNWIEQSPQPPADSIPLESVFFLDTLNGFACGGGNSSNRVFVLKTTNGGSNWNTSYYNFSNYSMQAIYFLNSLTGIGVGSNQAHDECIFRTTDGGSTWTDTVPDLRAPMWTICFPNPPFGYACCDSGIYNTTDAGISWHHLYDFSYLQTIYFYNVSTGWALANGNGGVYETFNGGSNWSYLVGGYHSTHPNSIYFTNLQTGWICMNEYTTGSIYQTISGGNNWMSQYSGVGIRSLNFISSVTGWAVGSFGTILKTTTGGVTFVQPISNEIPNAMSLYQNYPNPFNPSSKIKFQIAKTSDAKLTIFDLLGREVAVLVNEHLNPGTYEVEWDGSNSASGVYYYQLTVSSEQLTVYKEAKKMILIK